MRWDLTFLSNIVCGVLSPRTQCSILCFTTHHLHNPSTDLLRTYKHYAPRHSVNPDFTQTSQFNFFHTVNLHRVWISRWWVRRGLTSHSTHYGSFQRWLLQAGWPNQWERLTAIKTTGQSNLAKAALNASNVPILYNGQILPKPLLLTIEGSK